MQRQRAAGAEQAKRRHQSASKIQATFRGRQQRKRTINWSNPHILELHERFDRYDDDKRVKDETELGRLFAEIGWDFKPKMIHHLVSLVDDNGSGTIDFTEFLQLLCKHALREHEERKVKLGRSMASVTQFNDVKSALEASISENKDAAQKHRHQCSDTQKCGAVWS